MVPLKIRSDPGLRLNGFGFAGCFCVHFNTLRDRRGLVKHARSAVLVLVTNP